MVKRQFGLFGVSNIFLVMFSLECFANEFAVRSQGVGPSYSFLFSRLLQKCDISRRIEDYLNYSKMKIVYFTILVEFSDIILLI